MPSRASHQGRHKCSGYSVVHTALTAGIPSIKYLQPICSKVNRVEISLRNKRHRNAHQIRTSFTLKIIWSKSCTDVRQRSSGRESRVRLTRTRPGVFGHPFRYLADISKTACGASKFLVHLIFPTHVVKMSEPDHSRSGHQVTSSSLT